MPWMSIPIATAIAGAATAGATAYGAHTGSSAAKNAARTTAASTDRAMAIETDNEKRRREEYDREEAEKKRQFEAQQAQLAEDRAIAKADHDRTQRLEDEERSIYYAKEARKAPYRAASDAILRSVAGQYGISMPAVDPSAYDPVASYRPGVVFGGSSASRSAPSMASVVTADVTPALKMPMASPDDGYVLVRDPQTGDLVRKMKQSQPASAMIYG